MDIDTKREIVYNRDNYKCVYCGKHIAEGMSQMSHIIGQSKTNRKVFGNHIIDHILNVMTACNLQCNEYVDVGDLDTDIHNKLIEIYNNDGTYEEVHRLLLREGKSIYKPRSI